MQLELILPLGRRKRCIAEKVPFCYILWHELFLKGIGLKLLIEMKDDRGICAVSCRKSIGNPSLKLDFSISTRLLVRRAVLIKILFFSFLSSHSLMEKKKRGVLLHSGNLKLHQVAEAQLGSLCFICYSLIFPDLPLLTKLSLDSSHSSSNQSCRTQ